MAVKIYLSALQINPSIWVNSLHNISKFLINMELWTVISNVYYDGLGPIIKQMWYERFHSFVLYVSLCKSRRKNWTDSGCWTPSEWYSERYRVAGGGLNSVSMSEASLSSLKSRSDKIREEYMWREVKHVMFLQATTHKDAVREWQGMRWPLVCGQ